MCSQSCYNCIVGCRVSISLSGLHSLMDIEMNGREMGEGMYLESLGWCGIKWALMRLVKWVCWVC